MLTIILGAPGSGKTTTVSHLRTIWPGHAVLDWDDYMGAVQELTGRDVRRSPDLWGSYQVLVRTVVEGLRNVPTVLFGVVTPSELREWPTADWLLLDCQDHERRRRLRDRPSEEVVDAVNDAAEYRKLGLPVIDTTGKSTADAAAEVAERLSL